MKREGFASIIIALIVIGLLVVGGVWYWEGHKVVEPQLPVVQNATTTSPVVQATSSIVICGTDFSNFGVPPLPTSSYKWTQLTAANATSVYVAPPSFSSSTGEVLYPNAFSSWPSLSGALAGNEWFSPEGDLASLNDAYASILQKEGWTYEANIDGYQLNAEQADGFHGESEGYIKIEDGYFRSVVLYYLTGAPYPTNLIVYVSDIVPLSQIIPGYQPSCPTASTTLWLASIKKISSEVVSIPSSSSISKTLQDKIAFTQNGEVWIADQGGGNQLQLTHTSGTVSTNAGDGGLFAFSPDFHYLAYYILWPTGSRSYASGTIAILNLDNNQVVQKIDGWTLNQFSAFSYISQGQIPYVEFDGWVSNSQFIFDAWGLDPGFGGGGADKYGKLLVDLQKGTTTVMAR